MVRNATADERGLTEEEATTVRGWKRRLASVAIEEMLHMAQVANLLTAIGGAPHFRRANFPLAADAYPFGLPLTLEPFSIEVIERFVCYEMPEDGLLGPEQTETMSQIRARRVSSRLNLFLGSRAADHTFSLPIARTPLN